MVVDDQDPDHRIAFALSCPCSGRCIGVTEGGVVSGDTGTWRTSSVPWPGAASLVRVPPCVLPIELRSPRPTLPRLRAVVSPVWSPRPPPRPPLTTPSPPCPDTLPAPPPRGSVERFIAAVYAGKGSSWLDRSGVADSTGH